MYFCNFFFTNKNCDATISADKKKPLKKRRKLQGLKKQLEKEVISLLIHNEHG